MYTKEEEAFIKYWEVNRTKKKRLFRRILLGLPAGMVLMIAILLNFMSGWYKRASMIANADPSLFIILLIAGIIIVAFTGVFSSYHKWDINETRYKELINRK
ncbi:hypothetical protein [Niabella ginsengisoli]|uniref:DUF485 domain-containing protein n=1 Tax=Niabella ginsengisoli TaxID=522298 RepID=A0ABS9SF60_9BACT|nr:hypothetical protein [Niabella ginsengisoli]MCH5597002.1 hypothetical protein [Niabella ginsengisoli]